MTGYIPAVLVYALREGKVLVMHRNKEPNLGLWTAPGGKIRLVARSLQWEENHR
jgi:ADP-ribose pyrophosphatase YjhB (NUDIX family)